MFRGRKIAITVNSNTGIGGKKLKYNDGSYHPVNKLEKRFTYFPWISSFI